jgi:tetratricopeptide (TPR) repeat protein
MNSFFLNDVLLDYISDCENPDRNFDLALAYLELKQTAAATSFFMRAAERYEEKKQHEQAYQCLINAALCFRTQGNRDTTVKTLLLTALNVCPKRPEAYYNIAKMYKAQDKHSDCYTFANLALLNCDFDSRPLGTSMDFPGKYGLVYYKAVSSWWLGRIEECNSLYTQLREVYMYSNMSSEYKEKVLKDVASFNLF